MKNASLKSILEAISKVTLAIAGGILPLLYYFIIIATISGIASAFFSVSYLKNPGPLHEDKNVIIKSGSSVIKISKQLAEEQVVEYPQLFAILVKFVESGKSLKAGEYAFPPGITPMEVVKKIQNGDVLVRQITIPEGLLTIEIITNIINNPYLKGEVPDNIKDGDLLPQTYDFLYGDAKAKIIKRMQDAMNKTIDELWEKRAPDLILKTKQEALVLASIIEKETGVKDERKRVAAVFINRLKKNMRLQTDPSVIYAITNGKYVLDRPLSHKDLEIDSNYNTYKYSGLPPAPITNPGRASIEAALNPLNTDELYFVADGSGGHAFATTLEQHNANVRNWRKFEKDAKKGE